MLKIFKNRKAQNTAEYAILIALVVGGVIAMQTYAQRALQARLRDASIAMRDQTRGMNPTDNSAANTLQYEPYYSNSVTESGTDSEETIEGGAQTSNKQATTYANQTKERVEYNTTMYQDKY